MQITFSIEQLSIFVQVCEKETVDQGGLPQAGLPFNTNNRDERRIEVQPGLR